MELRFLVMAILLGASFGYRLMSTPILLTWHSSLNDCANHGTESGCLAGPKQDCVWLNQTCYFKDYQTLNCSLYDNSSDTCVTYDDCEYRFTTKKCLHRAGFTIPERGGFAAATVGGGIFVVLLQRIIGSDGQSMFINSLIAFVSAALFTTGVETDQFVVWCFAQFIGSLVTFFASSIYPSILRASGRVTQRESGYFLRVLGASIGAACLFVAILFYTETPRSPFFQQHPIFNLRLHLFSIGNYLAALAYLIIAFVVKYPKIIDEWSENKYCSGFLLCCRKCLYDDDDEDETINEDSSDNKNENGNSDDNETETQSKKRRTIQRRRFLSLDSAPEQSPHLAVVANFISEPVTPITTTTTSSEENVKTDPSSSTSKQRRIISPFVDREPIELSSTVAFTTTTTTAAAAAAASSNNNDNNNENTEQKERQEKVKEEKEQQQQQKEKEDKEEEEEIISLSAFEIAKREIQQKREENDCCSEKTLVYLAVICASCLKQATGLAAISSFLPIIFADIESDNIRSQLYYSVSFPLGSIFCFSVVTRFVTATTAFLGGAAGCCISSFLIGVALHPSIISEDDNDDVDGSSAAKLAVAGVILFSFFFGFTSAMMIPTATEIFVSSYDTRKELSFGIPLSSSLDAAFRTIITFVFPIFVAGVSSDVRKSRSIAFFSFAGLGFLFFVLTILFLWLRRK